VAHGYPIDQFDDDSVDDVKSELVDEVGLEEAESLITSAMERVTIECPGCA